MPAAGNCGVRETTLARATRTLPLSPFRIAALHHFHLLPPLPAPVRPDSARPFRTGPGTHPCALSHARVCVRGYARARTSAYFRARARHANAMQSLKISSAKRGRRANAVSDPAVPFWQRRYYDRNEWNHKEFIEKRKCIHRNPVRRGLVEKPEHWKWSSYRHYASVEDCGVVIESWRN